MPLTQANPRRNLNKSMKRPHEFRGRVVDRLGGGIAQQQPSVVQPVGGTSAGDGGIVQALLGGKISLDGLGAINQEIDAAHYTNSDPQTIILAAQAGLVGEKTGSIALGFDDDEYLAAREDHAARLKLIAESQGMNGNGGGGDPAARGLPDLSADPNAGAEEKAASRNTDLRDTTARRVRGKGRFVGE